MRAPATRPTTPGIGVLIALLVTLSTPPDARSEAAPIFLDGRVSDWPGPVESTDPSGDQGGSGIDFRDVDLANDDDYLFVRFQTSVEVPLQDGAPVSLYLDTDSNAATGLPIAGIGAELEWDFGARSGRFYTGGGSVSIAQNAIRLRQLPSVTASEFEIAIGRDVRPNGSTPLFSGGPIRLVLRDTGPGGDVAPDASGGIAYAFDPTSVPPPAPIAFSRGDPGDVRVVAWNTRDLEAGSGFDPTASAAADRVLSAIEPDIVCFEEVYNATASQAQALVTSMLPELGPWYATKQNDCHVVSRYPALQSWGLDGNLAVLLDADAALGTDLLMVCAHLPCCTNDAGRQSEVDHIMQFFRDAMTPGGIVDVPAGTAFMITGDLNLVGASQQLKTLLTGDIVNQATYGPDFAPDWDGTGLADVISSQTERRFAYSWRSDNSTFAPGRLDFIIYNDSVLELANHFLVYSPEMSADALAATGILANDVTTVSDHLPHVADFHPAGGAVAVAPPEAPAGLALRSQIGHGQVRFTLELPADAEVTLEVFDARGGRVRSLFPGGFRLGAGRHELAWDGRDDRGARAPAGVYLARVRAAGAGAVRAANAKWVLLR